MKKPKKLSLQEKECVRQWLKKGEKGDCPFMGMVATCENICETWFPETREEEVLCPCGTYSVATVRRVARKMLEE